MNDEYDPEFDSPEAKANFATRHIYNIHKRKKKRDELLEQYRREKVVKMFPGRGPSSYQKALVRLTVDYGHDIHSVVISRSDWLSIQAGEKKTVAGSGFNVDGEKEQDFWRFNDQQIGELSVYCDSGRFIYEGNIGELDAADVDA